MLMKTNPILQAMQTRQTMPGNLGQIKQMMNMVQNAGNPQAMLMNMAQSNPQLKQVMDIVNNSGGDPKAAFYKMAQEKGVDPDSVLNMLR